MVYHLPDLRLMTYIIVKEGEAERRHRLEVLREAHDTSEAADVAYHEWRNSDGERGERGDIKPLFVSDPAENRKVRRRMHENAGIDPDTVRGDK